MKFVMGPSPRLRGKRGSPAAGSGQARSIPAPAGETSATGRKRPTSWVHPRACGGNEGKVHVQSFDSGPSPRLRGKPRLLDHLPDRPGSIPAPAGETNDGCGRRGLIAVHPRACGGNPYLVASVTGLSGPSPRLRGKLREVEHPPGGRGSIPAPAGETSPGNAGQAGSRVHPRACGGNFSASRL